ncbi:hypothetical protein [Pontibacillus yanchengensis]|uniref:Uncharacterized protein n=1 Tax=Pontibacillus yanchengensis Y32 TaxID=1385514 RepID=A0A0A2THS7_9BACI|nr:hypothetical protein [Pontibacillus yanchengensis]KGP73626.1 hypothetical protein N782_03100 [Pontibacillus yanchengensis Y32]
MRQNAILRLMLACFLLYVAWPYLRVQGSPIGSYFWLTWLFFFLLVAGANLAVILRIPNKMDVSSPSHEKKRQQSYGKN